MLSSNKPKDITKAEALSKVEAFKTLNSILVQANAQYMNSLHSMLVEKEVEVSQLQEKLKNEAENAIEEDNARLLFLGGYVQCLKDILNAKKTTES